MERVINIFQNCATFDDKTSIVLTKNSNLTIIVVHNEPIRNSLYADVFINGKSVGLYEIKDNKFTIKNENLERGELQINILVMLQDEILKSYSVEKLFVKRFNSEFHINNEVEELNKELTQYKKLTKDLAEQVKVLTQLVDVDYGIMEGDNE